VTTTVERARDMIMPKMNATKIKINVVFDKLEKPRTLWLLVVIILRCRSIWVLF